MTEVIPLEDFYDTATAISYAIIHIVDDEVEQHRIATPGIDGIWEWACEIADEGPRTDMECRILAEAVARRLEGK